MAPVPSGIVFSHKNKITSVTGISMELRSYQAKPAGISHFYSCEELGVGNGQEGRRGTSREERGREKRMKKDSKKGWVHSKCITCCIEISLV